MTDEAEAAELAKYLRELGPDDVKRRVLIMVDDAVYTRLKDLSDRKVSLQPKAPATMVPGKDRETVPTPGEPQLKLDSNAVDTWMQGIVYKENGIPGIDLHPPDGPRAVKRLADRAASPVEAHRLSGGGRAG